MEDPRLARVPAGRLVGIAEIAALLGVTRETVDLWRSRDKQGRKAAAPLPTPVLPYKGMTTKTPLWDRDEIISWGLATGRLRESADKAS